LFFRSVDATFRDKCQADSERLCYNSIPVGAGNGEGEENDANDQDYTMPLGLVLSCLHRHVDQNGVENVSILYIRHGTVRVLAKQKTYDAVASTLSRYR